MTSLSAKYLLIQGQSRQTANVVPCAPSLATSVLYLSQMELRVLGLGCSPLQRPYPLFLLSLSPLAGRGWPFAAPTGQGCLASLSADAPCVICPSCRSAAQAE